MAATLGAILGPSIDVAQRVSDACVIHHDGKGYLEPGKKVCVLVHHCEYAHDEGRGLCVTREL